MLRAPVTCLNTIPRADYQLQKQPQLKARPALQLEFFLFIRAQGTCNPYHNLSEFQLTGFSSGDTISQCGEPGFGVWICVLSTFLLNWLIVESLRSAASTLQHNLLSLRWWRLISQCLLSQFVGVSFKIVVFLVYASDHLHFLVLPE